jgi:hypothetical protein
MKDARRRSLPSTDILSAPHRKTITNFHFLS